MKSLPTAFAAALVIALMSSTASAIPINGDISFAGTFTVNSPSNLLLATKFTSFSGVAVVPEPAVDNGSYEGTDGISTTFTPFTFAGPGAAVSVDPLWFFDSGPFHFSFTATTVNVSFVSANALVVEGEGVAHITGHEDAPGFWVITANKARTSFSFSSSAAAAPEPATIGVGAVGVAMMLIRRRRKTA